MFKKILFICCLLAGMLSGMNVFAQDTPEKQREAVDNQMTGIRNFNGTVNEAISANKLYTHRLTLNSADAGAKIWGGLSKYQENINFYFDLREGLPVLKKVIVLSEIASRQAYTDFLYDEQGNTSLCMYQYNVANATDAASRYYYYNKRLIHVAKGTIENTQYLYETDFGTQDVQSGIEMIARAESFKKIFDSLVRVQAPATK
ncbi:MAG: hypothetical protein IT273_01335 [Chitinophagales bacterium]|nr:hypothetical protein [Chitinophagales bacterium]